MRVGLRTGVWGVCALMMLWACGRQISIRQGASSSVSSGDATQNDPGDLDLSTLPTQVVPSAMSVKRGSVSDQSLATLGKKELSGTADVWSAYLEFYPASTGAAAVFTYDLPPSIDATKISALDLAINFRGHIAARQRWSFLVFDVTSRKWVFVGDNTTAMDWTWSSISLKLIGPFTRFVNASRKISIRYETTSPLDASDLDYLVLNVSVPGTPSPSPSPSPTPTTSPTTSPTPSPSPVPGTGWWKPLPGTSWQMQYSGVIDTSLNVQVYMLDMFGTSPAVISSLKSRGVKVVCYIDGGSWESYTPDAAQFPASIIGNAVSGWPDEKFLDIRSQTLLWPLMRARMDLAKSKGCDGIYHDWADSYQENTGFPLTATDQLTYNRFWVAEAHARGMSVGLINSLLQVADLVRDYDFAINEGCMVYNECSYVQPFIAAGKPVFSLNYSGDQTTTCSKLNALNFDGLFKKMDLGAYRVPCR